MILFAFNKKTAIYIFLAVFFVSLDRFFKILALKLNTEQILLKGLFYFSLEKNKYIAFSLPFSGMILNIVIILTILFLCYLLVDYYKHKNYQFFLPLIFIIFGAISNLLDRLNYGYVIDYLYLKHFTVFNIADSMIVLGAFFMLLAYIFQEKKVNN